MRERKRVFHLLVQSSGDFPAELRWCEARSSTWVSYMGGKDSGTFPLPLHLMLILFLRYCESAAVNTAEQVLLWYNEFGSFVCVPIGGISGSCGSFICSFLKNPSCCFCQHCIKAVLSPNSHPYLLPPVLLIIIIASRVEMLSHYDFDLNSLNFPNGSWNLALYWPFVFLFWRADNWES